MIKQLQKLRTQIAAATKAARRPAGQSPSDGAPSVRSSVLPGAEVATGDSAVALSSASGVPAAAELPAPLTNAATGALTAPDIHAATGLPVAPGAPHGLPAAANLPAAPLTSAATGAPTGTWVDPATASGLPAAPTWVPVATGVPAAATWVPAATGLPTATETLVPPIASQATQHSLVAPARGAAAVPHGWYPVAAPGGYAVPGSVYGYGAVPAHPQAPLQVGVSHQPAYPVQAYDHDREGQLRGQIRMLQEMLGYEQARRFYRP